MYGFIVERDQLIIPKVAIEKIGSHVRLKCNHTVNTTTILWFYNTMNDNGLLETNTTSIIFKNLSYKDFGTYYCYGEHSSGPFLAKSTLYMKGNGFLDHNG